MLFKTLHLRLRRNYCDWRCPPLSKTIRGDADVAHSQIIGGMQSNYWGDISPRVSAPLLSRPRTKMLEAKGQGHNVQVFSKKKRKKSSRKESQIFRDFSGKKKVMTAAHFLNQKIVMSSAEDRIFSRTFIGFEAKDLTFEAKAKDF